MELYKLINPKEAISYTPSPKTEISHIVTKEEDITCDCLYIIENDIHTPSFSDMKTLPKVIIASPTANIPEGVDIIRVKDPRAISATLHSRFFDIDYSKTKVIGITGTNGKTSTATMIYEILNSNGKKAGFIGTGKIEIAGKRISESYYSMTTPPPNILYHALKRMQECDCEYVVMEVSSHALAQSRVDGVIFEYAAFTNLSPEHLDYHKDMECYYLTKMKLLSAAKKVFVNVDDHYARRAKDELGDKVKTVGVLWRGNSFATEIEDRGFDGISYYYNGNNFNYKTTLQIPGTYNVYNSLLASSICIDMGIAPCKIKRSLANIKSICGRYEIIKDKISVIIDYAHTAEAFETVLKSINKAKTNSLTVVFGCGGERDTAKRPKIASIAECYSDKVIVTSDNPRNESPEAIINDIVGGFSKANYEIIEDRSLAIRTAISRSKEGDIVAIIGKGNEKYLISKNGYTDYSDKEIVYSALDELSIKQAK